MLFYQNPHKTTGILIEQYLLVHGLLVSKEERQKILNTGELYLAEGEFCFAAASSLEEAISVAMRFDMDVRLDVATVGYSENFSPDLPS